MQTSHSCSRNIPVNDPPQQLTVSDGAGDPKKTENQTDFVWRFSIDSPADTGIYDDPLVEMIRVLLKDFLDMGFVTFCGNRVRINGFALNNQPERVYGIFVDQDHPQIKPEVTSI